MNYQVLKGMLEVLINTFKCQNCGGGVVENDIDIVGAAGNTINIDICCKNCGKHTIVKAEVAQIDSINSNISPEKLDFLKKNIGKINELGLLQKSVETDGIKDQEIIDLTKDMKKDNLHASDLFN